jgi:beta-aspartyl-peptidase (threonine type)
MSIKPITIAVHGGAGPMSDRININKTGYEEALKQALEAGHTILKKGGRATEAVEASVRIMEDHPLFNSGHGSALNSNGEIEMDAAIMDGTDLCWGGVALVRRVKNPVSLAAQIMRNRKHGLISGSGAETLAVQSELQVVPESYFITAHQYGIFLEQQQKRSGIERIPDNHGTVGAVALDAMGNIAAATSTGGAEYAIPGRISDSCLIGAGCYADNATAALSCTGDGEYIISHVVAYTVAMYRKFTGCALQEACEYVVHKRLKDVKGDIGLISLDTNGNLGIVYNSERMHHAWITRDSKVHIRYK